MRTVLLSVLVSLLLATSGWARNDKLWNDDGERVIIRDQYGQPVGTGRINDGRIQQVAPMPLSRPSNGGQMRVDPYGNVRDQYGNVVGRVKPQ